MNLKTTKNLRNGLNMSEIFLISVKIASMNLIKYD
jgi:hypothetical protein